MEKKEEHRLKVIKGLEREAVILKLSISYFAIYAVVSGISLLFLITGLSFTKGVLLISSNMIAYMAIKYADQKNLLDYLYIQYLPKALRNDLYRKKRNGTNNTK